MIVDDEDLIRRMLIRIFEKAGYDVIAVDSSEEAIELVENEKFGVFFLDIRLPGMNGVDLCRKLRADFPASFFFAITGYISAFDLVTCREAGFDDYFTKPLDLDLLTDIAKDAFTRLKRWRIKTPNAG